MREVVKELLGYKDEYVNFLYKYFTGQLPRCGRDRHKEELTVEIKRDEVIEHLTENLPEGETLTVEEQEYLVGEYLSQEENLQQWVEETEREQYERAHDPYRWY